MAGTDNRRCPSCKSDNVARIQWGLPAFTEELERGLESGRVILGGCCIFPDSPEFHCNDCGAEFGHLDIGWPFPDNSLRAIVYGAAVGDALGVPFEFRKRDTHCNDCGAEFGHLDIGWPFPDNSLRAIVYGAAVGDALGVPFEFRKRDTFSCTHMVGGGAHGMPAGTFSDDTSLLLATCDSIKAYSGEIETRDMANRFRSWLLEGEYTVDGAAFDVGSATATALKQGRGCAGERSNGNGSLMRIAPLALTDADDAQIVAVSAITHAHSVSTTACVVLVYILRAVRRGVSLSVAIAESVPDDQRFSFLRGIEEKTRDEIQSTGYVLHTLEAALWCALNTESYAECVLAAVINHGVRRARVYSARGAAGREPVCRNCRKRAG